MKKENTIALSACLDELDVCIFEVAVSIPTTTTRSRSNSQFSQGSYVFPRSSQGHGVGMKDISLLLEEILNSVSVHVICSTHFDFVI